MTAPFDIATRLTKRVTERPGAQHHPCVVWAHEEAGLGRDVPDEVPWCGSFMALLALICGFTAPANPASARAWATAGTPVQSLPLATVGVDIVVLSRGANPAHGHVGLYAGHSDTQVFVLGGNQANKVSLAAFPAGDLLAIRRLQ